MRGQWQSQTRRLNRHYQSVGSKWKEQSGLFLLSECVGNEDPFDFVYVTTSYTPAYINIDTEREFNSSETLVVDSSVYDETMINGSLGYNTKPYITQAIANTSYPPSTQFGVCKSKVLPISNKFTLKTKLTNLQPFSQIGVDPSFHVTHYIEIFLNTNNLNSSGMHDSDFWITYNINAHDTTYGMTSENKVTHTTEIDINQLLDLGNKYYIGDYLMDIEYGDIYLKANSENTRFRFTTLNELKNYMNQKFYIDYCFRTEVFTSVNAPDLQRYCGAYGNWDIKFGWDKIYKLKE